jgi:hypothetical protein
MLLNTEEKKIPELWLRPNTEISAEDDDQVRQHGHA